VNTRSRLRDVAVAADERQLPVIRPKALDAPDEHAERRRVDEGRVREVDDDVLPALRDHVEQLLLELGRRVEVDLARQRDDVRVVAQLLRLDVEVHPLPRRRSRLRTRGVYPEEAGETRCSSSFRCCRTAAAD
jgi:hypothetical protein